MFRSFKLKYDRTLKFLRNQQKYHYAQITVGGDINNNSYHSSMAKFYGLAIETRKVEIKWNTLTL